MAKKYAPDWPWYHWIGEDRETREARIGLIVFAVMGFFIWLDITRLHWLNWP